MQSRVAFLLAISILLSDFVKLQAAVTGPVATDGDDAAAPVCRTWCQGPAAVPDVSSNHRVGFTMVRRSESPVSTDHSARLPFEETVTLVPGTIIDLETGNFNCTVPGTYVFMFSVSKYSTNHLSVHLVKNGATVVSGGSTSTDAHEQVSGGAVLVLQRGDSVYLTMQGGAFSNSFYFTSFSGFLQYSE